MAVNPLAGFHLAAWPTVRPAARAPGNRATATCRALTVPVLVAQQASGLYHRVLGLIPQAACVRRGVLHSPMPGAGESRVGGIAARQWQVLRSVAVGRVGRDAQLPLNLNPLREVLPPARRAASFARACRLVHEHEETLFRPRLHDVVQFVHGLLTGCRSVSRHADWPLDRDLGCLMT